MREALFYINLSQTNNRWREIVSIPSRKNWSRQPWLMLTSDDLRIERQQSAEEGRDIASVQAEFDTLQTLDLTEEPHQQRAELLLDRVQPLSLIAGYPYREPSDWNGILAERSAGPSLPPTQLSDERLLDKALGGWMGRASGCLLGKPAEGRRSWQIEKYLKAQNRWPLTRYFSSNIPREMAVECGFNVDMKALYEEGITCMVEDDDTNYTVTGLAILKQHGATFTPENVAGFWLDNIPVFHVCTAERVAYRNLLNGIPPPLSACLRNVYREWIGAQIRADFFGYVNPGDPVRAAEFAWRDACISHVKNGIYGEMWVAAMVAAAYVTDDIETVIRVGLGQIPGASRLHKAISHILSLHRTGISHEKAVSDLRSRWNEDNPHHWCHTISNAEIVAMALLWGNRDFEKTVCYAVMPGFDTDCNGATAGSVLGLVLGAKKLPTKWIAPLNDTLLTGVAGYYKVSLLALAQETLRLIQTTRKNA
jgi:ADP-ribosylglycohydrolase